MVAAGTWPGYYYVADLLGPDLSCLLDCFPEESNPGYCITSLLKDAIEQGTCDKDSAAHLQLPTGNCTIVPGTCVDPSLPPEGCLFDYITSGTCSEETE